MPRLLRDLQDLQRWQQQQLPRLQRRVLPEPEHERVRRELPVRVLRDDRQRRQQRLHALQQLLRHLRHEPLAVPDVPEHLLPRVREQHLRRAVRARRVQRPQHAPLHRLQPGLLPLHGRNGDGLHGLQRRLVPTLREQLLPHELPERLLRQRHRLRHVLLCRRLRDLRDVPDQVTRSPSAHEYCAKQRELRNRKGSIESRPKRIKAALVRLSRPCLCVSPWCRFCRSLPTRLITHIL